jgi:hypothetical protein
VAALAASPVVACSDDGGIGGGEAGAESDAGDTSGAGKGTGGSAGTSTTGGGSGKGGAAGSGASSGNGGSATGGSAGSATGGSAGNGGSGGEPSGGEGGIGGDTLGGAGAGGEGGTTDPDPQACALALECAQGETCQGSGSGQVCLPRALVCPGACPRNDGCNPDGTCIPALGLGAECTITSQCASGSRCWYVGNGPTKQCTALGVQGEDCKTDDDCATGLGCSFEEAEGKCAPLAQENQRCTNLSCRPDLHCSLDESGTQEVCRTMAAGDVGSYCNVEAANPKCNADLKCDTDYKCKKPAALGQSCRGVFVPFTCEAGAFCASDDKCHSVTPAVGEPCQDLGLYSAPEGVRCQAGSYCREQSGYVCVADTPLGQACDSTRGCANKGFCGPGGKCVAPAGLGQSCANVSGQPGTCEQGFCGAGLKCEPLVAEGGSCATQGCPLYGDCPNPCVATAYCAVQSRVCFKSPVKDAACLPHVNGDDASLCAGQWCCPRGQTCNASTECSDSPAPVGKPCLAKSGAAIPCQPGAFCNSAKVCQAFAAVHGECSEPGACGASGVCRSGQVGGSCE